MTEQQLRTIALADFIELGLDPAHLEEILLFHEIHISGPILGFSKPDVAYWQYKAIFVDGHHREWYVRNETTNGWDVLQVMGGEE